LHASGIANCGDLTHEMAGDRCPQENAEHPRERENDSEAQACDESLEVEGCTNEREEGQEDEGSSHLLIVWVIVGWGQFARVSRRLPPCPGMLR